MQCDRGGMQRRRAGGLTLPLAAVYPLERGGPLDGGHRQPAEGLGARPDTEDEPEPHYLHRHEFDVFLWCDRLIIYAIARWERRSAVPV